MLSLLHLISYVFGTKIFTNLFKAVYPVFKVHVQNHLSFFLSGPLGGFLDSPLLKIHETLKKNLSRNAFGPVSGLKIVFEKLFLTHRIVL